MSHGHDTESCDTRATRRRGPRRDRPGTGPGVRRRDTGRNRALTREASPGPVTATTESGTTHTGEAVIVATASGLDFLDPLDEELGFTDGREGQFTMERHVETDEANRATENVYVAGLANTWEYQTAVAIGDGAKAAVNLVSDRREEAHVDHDW